MRFADRVDAGKRLASALKGLVDSDAIVLAIPRGGVVVGFEVAKAFGIPLDVIIPRKIGAPGNPELAIGAMTEDGTVLVDNVLVERLGVSEPVQGICSVSQLGKSKRHPCRRWHCHRFHHESSLGFGSQQGS